VYSGPNVERFFDGGVRGIAAAERLHVDDSGGRFIINWGDDRPTEKIFTQGPESKEKQKFSLITETQGRSQKLAATVR
jgi:hypothetical protein